MAVEFLVTKQDNVWYVVGSAYGASRGYTATIRECPCDAPKHCAKKCKGRKCLTHKCEISPFERGLQVCHDWHAPRVEALVKQLQRLY
jgi:hypothetical protein